jgi:hypothetical protein
MLQMQERLDVNTLQTREILSDIGDKLSKLDQEDKKARDDDCGYLGLCGCMG